MSKKYNIDDIYSTKNQIKITIDQTGTKAMIRFKDEEKATLRQGFRVRADGETLKMGDYNESEKDCLMDALKRERYAHLAYRQMYFDLIDKLNSIGLVLTSGDESNDE